MWEVGWLYIEWLWYSHVLVCVDFNHPSLNWRDSTSPTDGNHPASLFMEAVRDSFLVQHVIEPTHYRGDNTPNTLDLIFTNESGMLDSLKYADREKPSQLPEDGLLLLHEGIKHQQRQAHLRQGRLRQNARNYEIQRLGDGTDRQDRRRTVDHHDGHHQRRLQKMYPQASQSREGHTKENEACMDGRKGNSCSEEEDGSIHEIQTVQRGTDCINYRRSANRVKAEVRKAVRTFEKMIAMEAKKNPKRSSTTRGRR